MKHSNKTGEFSSKSPGKCMNNVQQRLELWHLQFSRQQEPISKKLFAEKRGEIPVSVQPQVCSWVPEEGAWAGAA